MRRLKDVQVASPGLKISILPLPAGAPAAFSGAVGQYQINTIAGSSQISTNDAYIFHLEITGNGDARRWDPPRPVTQDSLDSYEPKILDENVRDIGHEVQHTRSIEYSMVPTSPGNYEVFVPFTFFNPVEKKFVTISSDTLRFVVTQGQRNANHTGGSIGENSEALPLKKLRYPLLSDRFWVSLPHLFLFGLFIAGSLYGVVIVYKRRKDESIPVKERMKSLAGYRAINELSSIDHTRSTLEARSLTEKVTAIYYRFLEEKFVIPPTDLEETKLPGYFNQADLPQSLQDRAMQLFRQCQLARYTSLSNDNAAGQLLSECKEVIRLLSA